MEKQRSAGVRRVDSAFSGRINPHLSDPARRALASPTMCRFSPALSVPRHLFPAIARKHRLTVTAESVSQASFTAVFLRRVSRE
jgi:hypothetical protein